MNIAELLRRAEPQEIEAAAVPVERCARCGGCECSGAPKVRETLRAMAERCSFGIDRQEAAFRAMTGRDPSDLLAVATAELREIRRRRQAACASTHDGLTGQCGACGAKTGRGAVLGADAKLRGRALALAIARLAAGPCVEISFLDPDVKRWCGRA